MTKVLLDQGVEYNAKSTKNWTPLHYASQNQYLEVVMLFLTRIIEAIQGDPNKFTKALHIMLCRAAENGHIEVVKSLLDSGAWI